MPILLSEQLSQQRLRQLDEWRAWSRETLHEVGGMLIATGRASFDDPSELRDNPGLLGLGPLDELLAEMDDQPEVVVLLTAYLGEHLIRKFDGHWIVDTDPVSDGYGSFIIDARCPESGIRTNVDIAAYAADFMRRDTPRSLLRLVMEIEKNLLDG